MGGCYSIRYMVDESAGLEFAMDFNWRPRPNSPKNQWTCSDTEAGTIHWAPRASIPQHGYDAVREHFGLELKDVSNSMILISCPAFLAAMRRVKEQREHLPRKVIQNMREGCDLGDLCADSFDSK